MICRKCKKDVPKAPYCCQCGAKQEPEERKSRRRGNGEGAVFKRGNTWTAQVTRYSYVFDADTADSHRVRKYATKGGFKTKREAIEYLDTLRHSQERKMPTLLELYRVYERDELPKLSKDKQTAYRKARERLEPIIGRKIDSLTTSDLQGIIDERASSYYTARDMKTVLSKLYTRAAADQFVSQNLSQYLVLPVLEEKESQPFTAEEVDKLWSAFADGNTFTGYLLLMIYSGMMPAELFDCKSSMIDLDKCEIYGCGRKTKKRKDVPIVFAECVRPVAEELINSAESDKLVSLTKNQWYDLYHKTVKEIGIRDLPPYSCRHTTGTEAARQNLNASTIQQIMRHSKITTSQKYIHLATDEAHTGINQIPKSKNQAS